MSVLAIDIETITPYAQSAGDIDFINSREFEVVCVGLGYSSNTPAEDLTTEVLFRDGMTPKTEAELLWDVIKWIQARGDIDYMVTYNGDRFDLRHLRGRADILEDELKDGLLPVKTAEIFSTTTHYDLLLKFQERHGHRRSFEDALSKYGVSVPEPVYWDEQKVTNSRIPDLGEEYILGEADLGDDEIDHSALRETLREYTLADIEPLFDLARSMSIPKEHSAVQNAETYTD